jgi:predicted GNAT family N-acyltransferase
MQAVVEIVRFGFSDKALAEVAFGIRKRVFVVEQNVDPALEYDHEESSHFYLLYESGNPVATGRWRETESGVKLERFAVLPGDRNKGLGSLLLDAVMEDIMPLNKKIYLHSQLKAIPFYERKGFVKKGDLFTEAGIEHYRMEYGG